jgi:4-hydroxy-tetrahydrodipicolinate synthase
VRGIIAALVTPYNGYGGIDTDGVGQLVERAIGGGVDGILVNSPLGEAPHLSRGERIFVFEAAIEAAAGRVPLYAGTGAVGAEETLALTWDAAKAGIAAAFIAAPFYYRLSQEALIAHYREIARRGRLPLVVHNAPTVLGNSLSPASLAELATVDGVSTIAQGESDMGQLAETVRLIGERLPILAARDSVAYPALCAGAVGLISAIAGVLPRPVVDLHAAFMAGEHSAARALWLELQGITRFLDQPEEAVAACKAALTILGYAGGEPRRPLPGLSEAQQETLRSAIASLTIK